MLKIIAESICVIMKSEGTFKKFTHGLTWAALSVIVMGILAMIIHKGI